MGHDVDGATFGDAVRIVRVLAPPETASYVGIEVEQERAAIRRRSADLAAEPHPDERARVEWMAAYLTAVLHPAPEDSIARARLVQAASAAIEDEALRLHLEAYAEMLLVRDAPAA